MTDKLSLYNGALRLLKERPLASLAENREPRRMLDSAWDEGAVNAMLEAGQWKFAKRSVQIDYDTSLEPDWGYRRVFDKPEDHIRTIGVWSDENMQCPYEDYRDEGALWYSSLDTLYVSYVSNSTDYGADMSMWPMTFVKFAQAHLATEIAGPLTEQGKDMLKLRQHWLTEALSKDAMADPTRQLPVGSWVRARSRRSNYRSGQPR